jgi:hypothetical protein
MGSFVIQAGRHDARPLPVPARLAQVLAVRPHAVPG